MGNCFEETGRGRETEAAFLFVACGVQLSCSRDSFFLSVHFELTRAYWTVHNWYIYCSAALGIATVPPSSSGVLLFICNGIPLKQRSPMFARLTAFLIVESLVLSRVTLYLERRNLSSFYFFISEDSRYCYVAVY